MTKTGTRNNLIIAVCVIAGIVLIGGLAFSIQDSTPPLDVKAARSHEEPEVEPNGDTDHATRTDNLGQKHKGKVSTADTDFWKVTLTPQHVYQLQSVKGDNDIGGDTQGSETNRNKNLVMEDGVTHQNTGNSQKEDIQLGLASSSGTLVVQNQKKNFTYTVPAGSNGIFYVKISSLNQNELHYKFVIKDVTNKE